MELRHRQVISSRNFLLVDDGIYNDAFVSFMGCDMKRCISVMLDDVMCVRDVEQDREGELGEGGWLVGGEGGIVLLLHLHHLSIDREEREDRVCV